MSPGERTGELREQFHTDEFNIGRSQEMVHKPGRELGVTAAHAVLIPPKHRLRLDMSEEFGVGFVQRGPMPVACPHDHVQEFTEVVAKTG